MERPIVCVRIEPEELELLDRLAAESGQRRSDVLRLAVSEWAEMLLDQGAKEDTALLALWSVLRPMAERATAGCTPGDEAA